MADDIKDIVHSEYIHHQQLKTVDLSNCFSTQDQSK